MARELCKSGARRVLDPAVGAGALLSPLPPEIAVHGCDSNPLCVALATATLLLRGGRRARLSIEDFLSRAPGPARFDAVICNPPYVRHHGLSPLAKQQLAARFASEYGLRFSGLTPSYVYFFLQALSSVRTGGTLVFLLPADFLDAGYGRAFKRVLCQRTTVEQLLLFDPQRLAFPEVLTTSAVLVVQKREPRSAHGTRLVRCELGVPIRRSSEYTRMLGALDPDSKWLAMLVAPGDPRGVLGRPARLADYLRIRRGIATGDNAFFVLDQQRVDEFRIEPEFLQPIIAAARDLPECELTKRDWERLRALGRPCFLLDVTLPLSALRGKRVRDYLELGRRQRVNLRFNCRTRTPWYRPENVAAPDVIVTYMTRGRLRFVRNRSDCRVLSVLLNGFKTAACRDLDQLLAVLNAADTADLLRQRSRTYAGGLTKIEPGELSRLPMPVLFQS
jgi:hypothetical protein